jgi:hypothetical protein
VLLVFVVLVGPTVFILNTFVQTTGYYLASLPTMSFWTETFNDNGWQNGWTVFYWGWWVSWAPFVGIFIARISGPHRARVHPRRAAAAHRSHLSVDVGIWRHGFESGAERRHWHSSARPCRKMWPQPCS